MKKQCVLILAAIVALSAFPITMSAQLANPQVMGGSNPRPQVMGGSNPRPQVAETFYSAVLAYLGF
ncbi:hypothetical protein [Granulicella arctica]|uniref:hypothetical protein n=1 Tax=Granulicella arctica TaxID=940613 RepID=UPI0021E0F67C|nr:hypothetical protein [Granulicella arctica]